MNYKLLPSVANASLPVKYEAAKAALRACNKLDECKDWADKTKALASYAKQSSDKEMENTAMRIRARAVRRCGELLAEIDKQQGGDKKSKGRHVPFDRKTAATEAGLSPDQAKTSIRVARVSHEDFEKQVESDCPPTITALAEQGKKKVDPRPHYEQLGITIEAFQAYMHGAPALPFFLKSIGKYKLSDIVAGAVGKGERDEITRNAKLIIKLMERLIETCKTVKK